MLVTRIIGKCPGCRREASFGNVNISQNILLRGCTHCTYSQEIPLPALSKVVIYLDQFFLSHAFRAQLEEFVKASEFISNLAHEQLVVSPCSSTHRIETHLWRNPQRQALFEFIKHTSRGHEFWPEYKIKRIQISRAFKRFLEGDESEFPLYARDALPREVNNWDDYFWIDVQSYPENIPFTRQVKEQSVTHLVNLFPGWRQANTTFEEDWEIEFNGAAQEYIKMYLAMAQRLASGDIMALMDSPIDTGIVETLLHTDRDNMDLSERFQRVIEFFKSNFFREVPCEYISTVLFAILKQRVKQGHFQNLDRAKNRLSGFLFDVTFISAYAPYCDSMFIDNPMFDLLNDPHIQLGNKYGSHFFARANWEDFLNYLESIKKRKTPNLEWALKLVHTELE